MEQLDKELKIINDNNIKICIDFIDIDINNRFNFSNFSASSKVGNTISINIITDVLFCLEEVLFNNKELKSSINTYFQYVDESTCVEEMENMPLFLLFLLKEIGYWIFKLSNPKVDNEEILNLQAEIFMYRKFPRIWEFVLKEFCC